MKMTSVLLALLIGPIVAGCVVASNADSEQKKLEQYDAGKPLPPIDEIQSNEPSGGD